MVARRRRQDWPLRLNAWLDSIRSRPFAWGTHDCVMGAADAVLAMTGDDPAKAFRGGYTTRIGASRVLIAGGGLEALATAALGEPLPGPRLAQRGDLVLVDAGPEGPALCVVLGGEAAGPGLDQAVYVPMEDWRIGWRV